SSGDYHPATRQCTAPFSNVAPVHRYLHRSSVAQTAVACRWFQAQRTDKKAQPNAARADASAGGAKPGATHTTGQAHPPPRAGARVDAARSHAVVSALLTLPSSATVTWTREVV